MYKFKNSLIALIGLVSLITVVTVMTPHIGYGSSGTAAPAPSTQNVNVVNTPTVKSQQDGGAGARRGQPSPATLYSAILGVYS